MKVFVTGGASAIWADSSKAEQELGWKTQYNLDAIIQTARTWHKTHLVDTDGRSA